MVRIKRLLTKIRQNPRYFWYITLIACDYYKRKRKLASLVFSRPNDLDLGDPCGLKKLHVILRTTDAVMSINSPRNLEDIGIISRNDVIRVGGCSLFKAGAQFAKEFGKENIQITLVVDRLSEKGMAQYREAATAAGLSFDVVEAKDHGNGPTFQTQIDIALQNTDDTLAFIMEDDYLLDDDAFTICFRVMRNHSNVIGMNPHFHPDRIRRHDTGKLVVIDGKLYGQIYNTCCTFFIPVSQIRRHKKNLQVYDGWEDGSVNAVWKKGICLSPLGWTMSEALHRSELSPGTSLLKDNKQL